MRRMILLVFMLLAGFPAVSLQAQAAQTCFAETGQCISGPIRSYWQRNGGLAVFGYPISAQREELAENRSLQVQWFERDRIEIQSDGSITAGRLGARYLELQERPWSPGPGFPAPTATDCIIFTQTGYDVCGPFRDYWARNGGVERFGYPIGPQQVEQVEGRSYTVQYFERRRMEYHPESAGTPYVVQLGLLGREIYTAAVCPTAPTDELQGAVRIYLPFMNCPSAYNRANLTIAWQRYEHGIMYWIAATPREPALILIVKNDDAAQRSTGELRTDLYQPGNPVQHTVPAGRIEPINGFGKIWWEDQSVQQALGWPLEPEQSAVGSAVMFRNGGWMLQRPNPEQVVVLQPNGVVFAVRANILPIT